jgi:serine/threonine-protein kinase
LDFGLAKLTKHDRSRQSLTAVGDVFGSPAYMSPEQCGGAQLDIRSDIYSIGCTLFESLTGRTPFASHVPGAVFFGHLESSPPTLEHAAGSRKFPQSMEAVMAKILRKDPDTRYQTLAELKTDLELVMRESGPQASPSGALKKITKTQAPPSVTTPAKNKKAQSPRRSRPKMLLLLGIWLAVLVGVGSCVYYQLKISRVQNPEISKKQLLPVIKTEPPAVPLSAPAEADKPADQSGTSVKPQDQTELPLTSDPRHIRKSSDLPGVE